MGRDKFILTEQDIELFDSLMKVDSSTQEYQDFLSRLKSDEVLAFKFHLFHSLQNEINSDALTHNLLLERFKVLDKKSLKRKKLLWYSFSIAACLALFVILVLNIKPKQQIYQQYKIFEPGLPIQMDNSVKDRWTESMVAYSKKEFTQCITLLQNIENDTAKFYIGICYEEMNLKDEAIVQYRKVQNSASIFILQKAKYHLALLLVRKDKSEATKILSDVASDGSSPYQNKAKELVKLLGK